MENQSFRLTNASERTAIWICYSPYQRELNTLYLIASPVIEAIFGLRTDSIIDSGKDYTSLVAKTNQLLKRWREDLPEHLKLDFEKDLFPGASAKEIAHRQQALSLQLTLNNLVIVLHRPLLARQVEWLSQTSPAGGAEAPSAQNLVSPMQWSQELSPSEQFSPPPVASSEHWWTAATDTSRITDLPQLAQIASDGHLVAFMAINLFNSAIVLVILALSDPLSDRAQLAKRYITRIFRLQKAFGERSTLSLQSSTVLQDVIRVLLRREEELMFSGPALAEISEGRQDSANLSSMISHPSLSVQDTLRLPLDAMLNQSDMRDVRISGYTCNSSDEFTSNTRLNESLVSVQQGE